MRSCKELKEDKNAKEITGEVAILFYGFSW